jgi:hypothetical protein
VMHGPPGGRFLAGYCLWSAGARIVVCDGGGTGTPRLRQDVGLGEGGRGLQVIEAVAARWGSFRLSGCRVVWCDFGQPLHARPGDAWAWLRSVLSVCALSPPAVAAMSGLSGYEPVLTQGPSSVLPGYVRLARR